MMLGVRADGAVPVRVAQPPDRPRRHVARRPAAARTSRFLADGDRHEVTTTAPTVRSAMAEAGVELRPQDRVDADLAAVPDAEQVVGSTRVDGKRVVEQQPIRFDTVESARRRALRGETRVVKDGKVGIRVARATAETYLDGELDSRSLRRQAGRREAGHPGAARRHQAAAAERADRRRAQLGGAGRLRVGRQPAGRQHRHGPYYGLYQFSLAHLAARSAAVGLPTEASAAEQTYRAQILYNRSGAGQWPVCGRYLFT